MAYSFQIKGHLNFSRGKILKNMLLIYEVITYFYLNHPKKKREQQNKYNISYSPTPLLWYSASGDSLKLQHRIPPELSTQDSPIHFKCSSVRKQPQNS
jgi:hypothetical protein